MSQPDSPPTTRVEAELAATGYVVHIREGKHIVVADEPGPGPPAGASPFGLVLSGLAACSAITLRMYAERKGWDLLGVQVGLSYRRTSDRGQIERTVHLIGQLDDTQRARLADIVERTPVTLALKGGIDITTTVR
jgi:putative redox protein